MRFRVAGSSGAEVPWKCGARSPSVLSRGDADVEAPPVKTIRARVRASEALATIGVAESSGNQRRELAGRRSSALGLRSQTALRCDPERHVVS